MINPPYATGEDIERCKKIVAKHLICKGSYSENKINEITLNIMNISYSTGGSYHDDIIGSYAEVYIKDL